MRRPMQSRKSPATLRGFLFYFDPVADPAPLTPVPAPAVPAPVPVVPELVVPLFIEPPFIEPLLFVPAVPCTVEGGFPPLPPACSGGAPGPPPPGPPPPPCASAKVEARAILVANAIVVSFIDILLGLLAKDEAERIKIVPAWIARLFLHRVGERTDSSRTSEVNWVFVAALFSTIIGDAASNPR
jgi:hypothetical protein